MSESNGLPPTPELEANDTAPPRKKDLFDLIGQLNSIDQDIAFYERCTRELSASRAPIEAQIVKHMAARPEATIISNGKAHRLVRGQILTSEAIYAHEILIDGDDPAPSDQHPAIPTADPLDTALTAALDVARQVIDLGGQQRTMPTAYGAAERALDRSGRANIPETVP